MAPAIATVVVDNASSDRTLPMLRSVTRVKLIANRQNLGFAAAANQGVRESGAEFLLLLNPDVRLLTGTGCFADDANLSGQAYAFVLRSPHAHALIARIDVGGCRSSTWGARGADRR